MLKTVFSALLFTLALGLTTPSLANVKLEYGQPYTQKSRHVKKWLETNGKLQNVVDIINTEFVIPESVKLLVGDKPENKVHEAFGSAESPYYDPVARTIYMPYGFANEIQQFYSANYYGEDKKARDYFVSDAMIHTLYHELGHALTDILDLPVVGKEEDAVDDFATLMMISLHKKGQKRALSAADLFWFEGAEFEEILDEDLMGEHSLDAQRTYQVLCLIYGSEPESYSELAADVGFDDDRMAFCEDRFLRQRRNWLRLLDSNLKKGGSLAKLRTTLDKPVKKLVNKEENTSSPLIMKRMTIKKSEKKDANDTNHSN